MIIISTIYQCCNTDCHIHMYKIAARKSTMHQQMECSSSSAVSNLAEYCSFRKHNGIPSPLFKLQIKNNNKNKIDK